MARLPIVGSDPDAWGTVLNEYLAVAHRTDGKLALARGNVHVGGEDGAALEARPARYHLRSFGVALDGSDQTTKLTDAIAAVQGEGGGMLEGAGDIGIAGPVTFPSTITFGGAGSAAIASLAPTRFVALDPAAQVVFGNGYGGGGHFCVDGANLATNPLVIKQRIGTFQDIDILNAAAGGSGWKCDGTQNSVFMNVNTSGCAGDHLTLDGGASSNYFLRCEQATVTAGHWGIRLDTTYGVGAGAVWYFPRDNVFDRCLTEYGTAGGALLLAAGENNSFRSCNLNRGAVTSAVNVVETSRDQSVVPQNSSGRNRLENCIILGVQAHTTAIKVGANTSLFFGMGTLFSFHAVMWDVNATGTSGRTDGDYLPTGITTRFTSPNGATENTWLKELAAHWRETTRPSLADIVESTQAIGDTSARFLRYANGTMEWGPGNAARDISVSRIAANVIGTAAGDKWIANGGLGVGNSAAATTPGTVTRKMEVFDAAGNSLGFVPIYDGIA